MLCIFFALRDDEFGVCEGADKGVDRAPKFLTRVQSTMAIGDLILIGRRWMRPNQDGNLLIGLRNTIHQPTELWVLGPMDAVIDERRHHIFRVELNDTVAAGELLRQCLGSRRFFRQPAEAQAHGTNGP